MTQVSHHNVFLTGRLAGVFARTAAPIVLITSVSGLFIVVDAYFLGVYAGAEALSAVTLIFPGMMLMIALQSLVSNGMASIVARKLGAGARREAGQTFASAHVLAIAVVLVLYLLYALLGPVAIAAAADGASGVAAAARLFMGITVAGAPVAFLLSLNIDALRCEGRIAFMALVTIAASLLNIAANWLLMAQLHWGVAGSAIGTLLAQAVCLLAILVYRFANPSALRPVGGRILADWPRIVALGAPMSLGFIGISLSSASVIVNLSLWHTPDHVATVGAYGIITRIMSFAYLPLMGVSIALQTIAGNNFGAGLTARVGRSLQIALVCALVYCSAIEAVVLLSAGHLGAVFVDDPRVIAETARILPWTVAAYFLFGQMLVLSGYFQSLGDAKRAAILGLSRPYLFTIPLTFLLPLAFGERGIWMVAVVAEAGMLALAALVLRRNARRRGWRYGLLPV